MNTMQEGVLHRLRYHNLTDSHPEHLRKTGPDEKDQGRRVHNRLMGKSIRWANQLLLPSNSY